jgi:crossover junction endodeoxyribonuclease RuvC
VTGYAVLTVDARGATVREAGVVRSDERGGSTDMAPRLRLLYDGLVEILDEYQPESMAVEQLFAHYEHPRTAILMGHARGVLLLAAGQRNIPVVSYTATRIKKTITGSGRASKEQVQRAVTRELGLASIPEPPDVADALAVALCHYYARRFSTEDA